MARAMAALPLTSQLSKRSLRNASPSLFRDPLGRPAGLGTVPGFQRHAAMRSAGLLLAFSITPSSEPRGFCASPLIRSPYTVFPATRLFRVKLFFRTWFPGVRRRPVGASRLGVSARRAYTKPGTRGSIVRPCPALRHTGYTAGPRRGWWWGSSEQLPLLLWPA